MKSGRRHQKSHKSVRRTASRAGFGATVAVAIALMFGMASGQVQASAISVGGSSNCAGADAWVATWVVSATGDSPTDTWRLDAPAGYSEFRSVAETIVVEQVQPLDQAVASLDVIAIFAESGSSVTATATMERPTACAAAPAPVITSVPAVPALTGSTDVTGVLASADAMGPRAAVSNASMAAGPAPASAQAPSATPTSTELPETGSTSGVLVALAFGFLAAGGMLLRLGRGPASL